MFFYNIREMKLCGSWLNYSDYQCDMTFASATSLQKLNEVGLS